MISHQKRGFRKGSIMFDFVLTVLLAIIIFGPAVMIILKFFGFSSDQAKESFFDFVEEIEDFKEESSNGELRSLLLILDENSYVAKFDAGRNIVSNYQLGDQIWSFQLSYPPECSG